MKMRAILQKRPLLAIEEVKSFYSTNFSIFYYQRNIALLASGGELKRLRFSIVWWGFFVWQGFM